MYILTDLNTLFIYIVVIPAIGLSMYNFVEVLLIFRG
jgi:hypothetical protein